MTTKDVQRKVEGRPPLWLPVGSVRAILALGTLGSVVALLFTTGTAPDWFVAIAASVFTYYFRSREGDSSSRPPESK